MNKKALIIGISGQDGSYLADLLLGKGYEVIGTSRDASLSSFANLIRLGLRNKVQVESVSLNDFRSVIQVFKKYCPDEVYNLAGQSSVSLSFEQPVETFESISIAVLNLLEAIRFMDFPIRLYNASSSECFGNTNGQSASDKTSFFPRSPYAVAKSAAFWQVANYREAYGMFACSGLLFNHESPLRPSRFVTQKIVKAACKIAANGRGRLKLGNLSVQRDWGWAPEYVKAMWMMLQHEEPDDFVIATGQTNSLQSFVEEVFSNLDLDWREHVEYSSDFKRPTDIDISIANTEKAEKKLQWKASYYMRDVARMLVEAEKARK
ncbi:MAG: GDP-mannose 4,6-dehydratase [Desulfobacteraceae bacterium]|nr:GDP-mannose 4,6-dehydratase [Desulfobacteraceae bacterium]